MNKSVKEVLDERARKKRKLQQTQDSEESSARDKTKGHGNSDSRPINGMLQSSKESLPKRVKVVEERELPRSTSQQGELSKKPKQKDSKSEKKKKIRGERKPKEDKDGLNRISHDDQEESNPPPAHREKQKREGGASESLHSDKDPPSGMADAPAATPSAEVEDVGFAGLDPEEDAPGNSSPQVSTADSAPGSPTFDTILAKNRPSIESASSTTSLSSTLPPSEKTKHIRIPDDTSALRARLAARIEALRAARKADVDGKPIRTRQELIEARRVKQAERKAHKKELRRQARLEEDRKREEALASARNSPGSVLSPLIGLGTEEEAAANHFAFGRVAFADGTQMSHDLSYVKDAKKKKGPAAGDHKAQLAVLETAKKRMAGLDDDKRKEVLEKETWLAARRRAEGQKIHDDEALLKKAVKRKERAKKKSEREWSERASGVEKSMKERQKKREDNIRKRKEDKMLGKAKKRDAKVKKGRAGFEGSFGR